MILCAGLGTRLLPLTRERPKPLVPIGSTTPLALIAEQLAEAGQTSALINTHHLPQHFEPYLPRLALPLEVSHEQEILGTAGGVAAARGRLAAPLIVYNGDILTEPPLQAMLERVNQGGICLAVAAARDRGTVGVDAEGRVVRLRGTRVGAEVRRVDYVGVAALGDDVLDELPSRGCLIGDVCIPRLEAGGVISSLPVRDGFSDLGDPASYLHANLSWLEHAANRGDSFVAADAAVAAAVSLERSVVLAGASVAGSGSLRECVVWPGSAVAAPLSRSVVTPQGSVSVARA